MCLLMRPLVVDFVPSGRGCCAVAANRATPARTARVVAAVKLSATGALNYTAIVLGCPAMGAGMLIMS